MAACGFLVIARLSVQWESLPRYSPLPSAGGQESYQAGKQQQEGSWLGNPLAANLSGARRGKTGYVSVSGVVGERSRVDLGRKGDGDRIADDQIIREGLPGNVGQ